jgi:hypothetical protein
VDWALACPGGLVCDNVGFSPLRTNLIFYPPIYPYFIAGLHTLAGSLLAVKIAQALLGAAFAVAVARVGASALGARVGTGAGLMAALYPELVWFAAHFWSEVVFLFFLWWAIERLFSADRQGRTGPALVAGLLWGLTVLTRETVFYFIPVAALWLAWRTGAAGRKRALLFAATALLTVAPWTYRNWVAFDAFIPVSTAGGQNLFQGNALIARDETYRLVDQVHGRVAQYRYATRMGLSAIWERQPLWIFEKLRDEMPNFWEADNLAVIHVKRGAYGHVSVGAAWAVAAVTLLPYLAVLAGFAWGLARLPWTRATIFLLLFLVFYNAIHIVTHGFARYRLPIMPVLFMVAAWGWLHRAQPALSRARRLMAAAVAVGLAAAIIPSVEKNLGHRAFGGTKYP